MKGNCMALATTTPIVPQFVREAAGTKDTRIGAGIAGGRAVLPLAPSAKRIWLDTRAKIEGDGKSPASPFRTEAQAYAALGPSDQLMIASGSVLLERLPPAVSGVSLKYPTVVQSYDRLRPDTEGRFGSIANKVIYRGLAAYLTAPKRGQANNFALRGIRLEHDESKPLVGYSLGYGISGLLIEGCAFQNAQLDLNTSAGATVNIVRQCVFYGQWKQGRADGTVAHAQGIYISECYDAVIEDCVFFHCGWKRSGTRATPPAEGGPTIFNHAIYAAVHSGGVVRRCVFVEPSSHGAQLRGNWHSHDNIFIACPLALLHGGGMHYNRDAPDGVMALAYRNVVTIAEGISPTLSRGIGIEVANTRAGSVVELNLIAGAGTGRAKCALAANADEDYLPNPTTVTFRNNTNAWADAGYDKGAGGKDGWPDRVHVTDIDNLAPADLARFVDPFRDGVTAAKALGFGSIDALAEAMIVNPTATWAAKLAAHIRAGFAPAPAPAAASLQAKTRVAAPLKGAVRANGTWAG